MPKRPKKFYKKAKPQDVSKSSRKARTIKKTAQSRNVESSTKQSKMTKKESPRNNRSITEKVNVTSELTSPQAFSFKRSGGKLIVVLLALVCIISVPGILFGLGQVKDAYKKFETVDTQRKQLETKYNQLEETAIMHPGSRDIYLQLAIVSYQLKNMKKAEGFVERALTLDPNYQPALELKQKINR